MKKKQLQKKLSLNKNTISALNEAGMMAVQGGSGVTECIVSCHTEDHCRTNEQPYCPSIVNGCGSINVGPCKN